VVSSAYTRLEEKDYGVFPFPFLSLSLQQDDKRHKLKPDLIEGKSPQYAIFYFIFPRPI
jgi:hypothetical protein